MKDNSKEVSITFRTTKEVKDALQKLADSENRKLSNMIEVILKEAIQKSTKKGQ